MKPGLLLYLVLALGGCTAAPPQPADSCPPPELAAGAHPDSRPGPPAPEPYPPVALRSDLGETPAGCEKQLVADAMAAVEEVICLRRSRDPANTGRGDHAKPLGCYRAEFTVSPPEVVRAEDRSGIARGENLGRTFDAIVRLSNSEPRNVPDFRSATTGLAVKVMLDPAAHSRDEFLPDAGREQDFVAGGLRTFVASGISDYADLFRLRIHQYSNALLIRERHPGAFRVFGTAPWLRYFNLSPNAAPMVLEQEYFSSLLPYAWGDAAVKFRFKSCHGFDRNAFTFSRFESGYQARLVSEFLRSRDICYILQIQKRPRPGSAGEEAAIARAFPVEDGMADWPESGAAGAAPFREVARLIIRAGTPAMKEGECEDLAFNPWNGLAAHQPLGSLNRARWAVYRKSESVRKDICRTMAEGRK